MGKRKYIELGDGLNKEEERNLEAENNELSAADREKYDRLDIEYFDRLPPGYRFTPTEQELITEYLNKKVQNLPLPVNRIRDANIYKFHPQQLTDMYKLHRESEWYYFSPRSKRYQKGKLPDRSAGHGYWRASAADVNIQDDVGRVIGFKKALVYYEGKSRYKNESTKTDWMMYEYKTEIKSNDSRGTKKNGGDMTLDDWVLCKIYNKTKKPNNIQQEDKGKDSAAGMPATKVRNGNDEVTAVTSTEITGGKKGIDDPEADTENTDTEKEISAWDGDRVLRRSHGASTSGDTSEGKEVMRVGDKAMADGIRGLVHLLLQQMVTSEEAGFTPKTGDSCETLTEKLVLSGLGRNLGARAVNEEDGIDNSEAATENANTEKQRGDLDSQRVLRRSEGASISGDSGKVKEVVRAGDKAYADGIRYLANLLQQGMVTSMKAGDTPKTRDGGETVPGGVGRSLGATGVNKRDESTGGEKGIIDGSEAAKKAKGAAPKVGNDNDEVKAVTKTSVKIQETEANIEEKQSEKNGNADGEGSPSKSCKDPKNKK